MVPDFHFVFFTIQKIFHTCVKYDFLCVNFKHNHWVVSHFTYQTLANRGHVSAEESSSGQRHSVKLILLITANRLSEEQCLPYCQMLQKKILLQTSSPSPILCPKSFASFCITTNNFVSTKIHFWLINCSIWKAKKSQITRYWSNPSRIDQSRGKDASQCDS